MSRLATLPEPIYQEVFKFHKWRMHEELRQYHKQVWLRKCLLIQIRKSNPGINKDKEVLNDPYCQYRKSYYFIPTKIGVGILPNYLYQMNHKIAENWNPCYKEFVGKSFVFNKGNKPDEGLTDFEKELLSS
jgi:hypothetical protein